MIALCEIDHALEDGIKSLSPYGGGCRTESKPPRGVRRATEITPANLTRKFRRNILGA